MGRALAAHLVAAGLTVTGVDPSPDARAGAEAEGIASLGSIDEAGPVDAVLASVPGPRELLPVAERCLDPDLGPPECLINLSTIGPKAALEIAGRLAEGSPPVAFVEAPVTGGVLRARRRECSILLGADDEEARAFARPLLEAMASRVIELDGIRAASVAKLVNNVAAVSNALGTLEALELGAASGLELPELFAVLEHGTARSYVVESTLRRPLLEGDYDTGFAMRLALKDMRLALDWGADLGLDLPRTWELVRELQEGVDDGFGEKVFPVAGLRRNGLLAGARG